MSSQTDFKHALRKLEFPACAKEALPRIESIIISRSKQNFAIMLISEFIFLENDVRKIPTQKSNAFSGISIDTRPFLYFSQPGPDATRNAVFLS